MAVTLNDWEFTDSSSATSLSVNTGVFASKVVGDLMVAAFMVGSNPNQTLPSGWTAIRDDQGAGGNTKRSFLSYKYMDASDVAGQNLTWSISGGSQVLALLVLHIKGMRPVSAISDDSGQGNTASTTVTAPTVTPVEPNSMILFFGMYDSNPLPLASGYALATSSPSFTEILDGGFNTNYAMSAAYGIRPEITATGNCTATLSESKASIGQMLVISAPQSFSVSDTSTLSDSVRYNLSCLINDTLTLTDTVSSAVARAWTNLTKNISTWVNQSKS